MVSNLSSRSVFRSLIHSFSDSFIHSFVRSFNLYFPLAKISCYIQYILHIIRKYNENQRKENYTQIEK